MNATPLSPAAYKWPVAPTWCPGCGNFGIHMAVQKALVSLGIAPHEVLLCFDIGCNGNMSDKIGGYRAHGLHGRVLPLATGAAVSNRKVKVIAFAGDGATYGEGVNHFIAALRSNYDITFIVHNNGTYGLTTGQASPTTPQGTAMLGQLTGVPETPLDPLRLAFACKASFIARGHSAKFMELVDIIKAAVVHTGSSYIDIIQACPTYDKAKTFDSALAKMKDVSQIEGYDDTDYDAAFRHATNGEYIPHGVLYRAQGNPDYYARLASRQGRTTELTDEVEAVDITSYVAELV